MYVTVNVNIVTSFFKVGVYLKKKNKQHNKTQKKMNFPKERIITCSCYISGKFSVFVMERCYFTSGHQNNF